MGSWMLVSDGEGRGVQGDFMVLNIKCSADGADVIEGTGVHDREVR